REPAHWEAYPGHRFIDTVGRLPCCQDGGCWKRRTFPLGDGHENDQPQHLCSSVIGDLPRCMDLITPSKVIDSIEEYFRGGTIRYLTPGESRLARRAATIARGAAVDEDSVTPPTARRALERYITHIPNGLHQGNGRGIVMGVWGLKYFPCAWVCI